jgi:hypothetical protein
MDSPVPARGGLLSNWHSVPCCRHRLHGGLSASSHLCVTSHQTSKCRARSDAPVLALATRETRFRPTLGLYRPVGGRRGEGGGVESTGGEAGHIVGGARGEEIMRGVVAGVLEGELVAIGGASGQDDVHAAIPPAMPVQSGERAHLERGPGGTAQLAVKVKLSLRAERRSVLTGRLSASRREEFARTVASHLATSEL